MVFNWFEPFGREKIEEPLCDFCSITEMPLNMIFWKYGEVHICNNCVGRAFKKILGKKKRKKK